MKPRRIFGVGSIIMGVIVLGALVTSFVARRQIATAIYAHDKASIESAAGKPIQIEHIDLVRGTAMGSDGCNTITFCRTLNGEWAESSSTLVACVSTSE